MGTDATVSVALIIAVAGLVVTIYNFFNGRKKDTQAEDAKMEEVRSSMLKVNLKLDSLCSNVGEIRTDIKAMQTQITSTQTEVAVMQRDLKTAFSRIDELKSDIEAVRTGK